MVRAVDRVYTRLRADILDGVHPPGARLGEAELAATTGASRTPVREALRRLEVEGLVEVLPHRGARVPDWTPEDLEEIYDLRMLLESAAARRAATRVTAADVDRMDELCRLMEAAVAPGAGQDLDRVANLNTEFHDIVRAAASSGRLVSMLNAVVRLPLVMRTFHRYSPADLARSSAHHRELAAALRAGDGTWAESVTRAHVLAAKAVLLRAARTPDDRDDPSDRNDHTETRTG
ncbi:GntR family transcriptional regulator [Actinomadura mexicana]|uniref:DNA-binding transcriptional regulator, GntR family n=1 Tax=Actinomadura mexicana TaxID=134959 RepID=A0A239GPP7_9ACTN|nr:GntR family transcriptional regulator [Actinomadura mexicana]SNS71107.1 DNA-binding transcriptional regulator, GntR family [Actinomadura mexicana]